MDRLKRTNHRTTGKKKLNIKKIGFDRIREIIIGIIIGAGSFMVFITTFGISYRSQGIFSGGPMGGLIRLWNDIACKLAEDRGIFYNQLEGASGSSGLCLTAILIFLVVVSALIVLSRRKWLAVIYPVFAVLPTVVWGLHGSVLSFAVLALGVLLFLAEGQLSWKNWSGPGYILVIAFIAFALLSVPGVSKFADKPSAIENVSQKASVSFDKKYYGSNPLKDGDLTIEHRSKGKGVALEVAMEEPQAMYLRGFIGDVLGEKGWEPLSNSVYYQNRGLVYWLNKSGFNGLGQIQQTANLIGTTEGNEVTVWNVNADSKYAYVPYEISDNRIKNALGESMKSQNWGDSFITPRWPGRLREYSYSCSENLTGNWTEIAARYYTSSDTSPERQAYDEAELRYNNFVYDNYLYISEDDLMEIESFAGDSGDQKRGHLNYASAIASVKSLLSTNFVYSEDTGGFDSDLSPVANILYDCEGYDAQYATAATMLFRYYGIPARYVEGYFITQEDAEKGNGMVDVPRSRNHAWTEIYVDGVGFVPVETCPEYQGLMPEADYTIGIDNTTGEETPDNSRDNTDDPNDVPSISGTSKEQHVPSLAIKILGILAGLIILAAIVLAVIALIRKLRRTLARNKLFKKGEPKEAARAIYRRMEELQLQTDEEAVDIGNRATYSEHLVSDKERQTMIKKLGQFRKEKRKSRKSKRAEKIKKLKVTKKDTKGTKDTKGKKSIKGIVKRKK